MPFPRGEYTPFGYLSNPGHRAHSWRETSGGNLRTLRDWLGVGWAYPTQRRPSLEIGLALEVEINGRPCRSRNELAASGTRLYSAHHSCAIFGLDFVLDGAAVEARFFLDGEDALCVLLSGTAVRVRGVLEQPEQGAAFEPLDATPRIVHAGDTGVHVGLATAQAAVLARGHDEATALARAHAALEAIHARYAQLLREDDAFYATCPMLEGDWPAGWREGLHYDFETTRLLVQPPGGIFKDVWPAWMSAWPRIVLAEGTLDMLRLAYADPAAAQRAVLSMFRDAPRPNVPCVFFDGSPNMVAADGSVCGTSPAWCLPFLSLELLYLRTLDRAWLGELYPHLGAYLGWWLEQRRDADGWMVYKCTWEAGEDGNPRLDPSGSGDADISGRVRPAELQATVAHAARVLAFFASELGVPDESERWRDIEAEYTRRTRQLFDPAEQRYRDWVVQPRAQPPQPYWGIDSTRYSALSVTPLLIGLPLDRAELVRHAVAPWILWPSWMYALVESAAAADMTASLADVLWSTIERVYAVTTRHELGNLVRPMPGSAPEFWPLDWRSFDGSEAYGWGATTANLLIRHVLGWRESRRTDGCVFELAPAFPEHVLDGACRLGIGPLTYRGVQINLEYVIGNGRVQAEIGARGTSRTIDITPGDRHEVEVC